MPITHAKFAKSSNWLKAVLIYFSVSMLSNYAQAVEISTPVGVQEIGKRLDLKSSLRNLPEGSESQLRSTCLSAKYKPLELSEGGQYTPEFRQVFVNFESTSKQGGRLEFKSPVPMDAALIELELVSECPLLVFTTRWSLILSEGKSVVDVRADSTAEPATSDLKFDLSSSRLLAASKQTPRLPASDKSWEAEKTPTSVVAEKPDETTPEMQPIAADKEPVNTHRPVEVASVADQLLPAGLIESPAKLGLGFDAMPSNSEDQFQLIDQFASIVGLLALGFLSVLGFQWYRRSKMPSSVAVLHRDMAHHHDMPTGSPGEPRFHNGGSGQDRGPVSHAVPVNQRVLESLIGADEIDLDLPPESTEEAMVLDYGSSSKSSLKVSLEMINRADIRSWNLPESYQSIVDKRNKALELHRTMDALTLRSQIGLVELAFQEAKQGAAIRGDCCDELLQQVFGDQIAQMEDEATLYVPDVVKTYVRAKMCEIVGAEKRQLLKENLLNLNSEAPSHALCFGTNAWREFLSEEGILD